MPCNKFRSILDLIDFIDLYTAKAFQVLPLNFLTQPLFLVSQWVRSQNITSSEMFSAKIRTYHQFQL